MMVFRSKGAYTFKLKVRIPTRNEGEVRTFSTGARDKSAAQAVERFVQTCIARRRWAPLELVFDGLASLGDVYDAELSGRLGEMIARFRDVDLDPLVTEWATRANAKYVRQVRRFIPAGARFPASSFRRRDVSAFLAGLDCDNPTRNRYRAALSAFGKWLVEREVIETNVVRDVAMYPENDPRMVWMTWDESIRVADAAPEPYRTLYRLMAATGIELGAALKLERPDVDLKEGTIAVRGTKTAWRSRVVRFEVWATYHLAQRCQPLLGFAPLFPGLGYADTLDQFKAAQKAVGISGHRLHDLRHTYAVNALKQGYSEQVVAHQLGHKNTNMVRAVYGRFIPDETDYQVTKVATTGKKRREVKRAK